MDDLKTFQKSEQKLVVVSNKIKSVMHDMGLELNLEKCASVHLKHGKYAASENLPIDKDSTMKALQQADTYKFLGKEESIKQLNDMVMIWSLVAQQKSSSRDCGLFGSQI